MKLAFKNNFIKNCIIKNIYAASCLLLVASCATVQSTYVPTELRKNVSTYLHAEYGTVTGEDPRFISTLQNCKDRAYQDGINVDGSNITDVDTLNQLFSTYLKNKPQKKIKNFRDIPTTDKQIDAIVNENPEDPDYINAIRRARKSIASCRESAFKLIRMDVYHKETG